MNAADWIILGFLAFSVAGAAIGGFFFEAFQLAGWIVGYLLAAWQYPRLAGWFAPHLKSPWVGEMVAFLVIFFCRARAGKFYRTTGAMVDEESLLERA